MNYDFLTVEEYNDVVLEHGEGFREDYALSFSKLNGLTVGTSYIIDGFINVEAKGNNIFDLTVMNELFTGAFCLTDCTSSSYHVVDSDSTEHLLNLQLTIGSDDLADGGLLLHLANTSESFTVTDEPYMITGETVQVGFFNKQTSFNLLIEDNEGEAYTGNVTLDGETVSVTDGVLTFNHTPTASENIGLTIGDYHTILRINCVKQNIVYSIDYESSDLYQHIRKAKLVIKTLKGVNGTLKCNGKTATAISNNQGVLTFSDLDLSNHENTELNCKIELTGTYSNPYSDKFTIDTPVLSGDAEAYNLYNHTLKPKVYNLTGIGSSNVLYANNECIINYVGTSSSNLIIDIVGNNKVVLNNYNGILQIFAGHESEFTVNDSSIGLFNSSPINLLEDSRIILNNCNLYVRHVNIDGELICNYCNIRKQSGLSTPLFKVNGNITFKQCEFKVQLTTQNKNDIYLFEVDKNAIINNTKGAVLLNNNFPFTDNKSDINITLQETGHTTNYQGVNGVIWTVTGTGETYTQNITITEE